MTHTSTERPDALAFANDRPKSVDDDLYQWAIDAEAMIRLLHASAQELEAALSMMYEFFKPNAWGSSENRREALEAASNALGIAQENQG